MKRISEKQLQMVTTVIKLGLRDMITGIDSFVYSAAEQRREMREVNRHKKACVDLLAELKLHSLGLSK